MLTTGKAEIPSNDIWFKYDEYAPTWAHSYIENLILDNYFVIIFQMILRISYNTIKVLFHLKPVRVPSHTYDQTIKSLLDQAKFGEIEEMKKKI